MRENNATTSFFLEQERANFKRNFTAMIKVCGAACNLDCDYCYYIEKEALYPSQRNVRMSLEILEKFIHDFIHAQAGEQVTFIWHGGEPTLAGLDYFKEIIRLQNKYANGKKIENSLQTNGTLITDEWAEFLAQQNFLCGLSIDGPQNLHDCHRHYPGGKGSWEQVVRCARLFQKHGVEFNTMTTVNATNAQHPVAVYESMKELGSHFMQFIPIVEQVAEDETEILSLVTPGYKKSSLELVENVSAQAWGNFLCRIFDHWVKRDVGIYYVNIFDNTLAGYLNQPQALCSMSPRCTCAPAIEKNGDVYICDHLVFPEYLLGNILKRDIAEMVKDNQQLIFEGQKQQSLSPTCQACEFLAQCGGDCPKNRFSKDSSGAPISSLCAGFYTFFKHSRKHFEFMASQWQQGLAPANVMKQRFK